MAVPLNHVYVTGGDAIVDAIEQVVQYADDVVSAAAQEQIEAHHQRMQEKAAEDERWASMASDLQYWTTEDGSLAYGIPRDHPRYADAVRAEYGDEHNPPSALIRMGLVNGVSQMGWSLQQAFFEAGFR
jgi:hypothetical protein